MWLAELLLVYPTSCASEALLYQPKLKKCYQHNYIWQKTLWKKAISIECNLVFGANLGPVNIYIMNVCGWGTPLPRSVLGLASSCLNLSSRLFSRTVMGGAPDAFWSEMRATSGIMGRTGRMCCFSSMGQAGKWKCNKAMKGKCCDNLKKEPHKTTTIANKTMSN